MTDDNNRDEKEVIWGEISPPDILKKKYGGKSFNEMTEKEVSQMLEDLI